MSDEPQRMPVYTLLVSAVDALEDGVADLVDKVRGPHDEQARIEAFEKVEERFEKVRRLLDQYGKGF